MKLETERRLRALDAAKPDIPVGVDEGGTGRQTSTTAYGLIAAGTTATGAHQTLAAGATTEILVGGGASALPAWTTATGSAAPVRATQPSFTNTIGVGAATAAASGAGITFPATQSASTDANTLDDYEEGTWTPSDNSGAGLSFTTVIGFYTKIGNLVNCSCTLTYPATASGLGASIAGLPFTTKGNGGNAGNINYSNANTAAFMLTSNSGTFLTPYTLAGVQVTNAQLSASIDYFGATYNAA